MPLSQVNNDNKMPFVHIHSIHMMAFSTYRHDRITCTTSSITKQHTHTHTHTHTSYILLTL
ncbi:hypothetical protein K492DRAFT_203698 [Lichtheimia hyalospora FSU 10163]|nr:hypothetical protein K492DRAFT_203698 [Lichtheimia hyalospora FSU 10163]